MLVRDIRVANYLWLRISQKKLTQSVPGTKYCCSYILGSTYSKFLDLQPTCPNYAPCLGWGNLFS